MELLCRFVFRVCAQINSLDQLLIIEMDGTFPTEFI